MYKLKAKVIIGVLMTILSIHTTQAFTTLGTLTNLYQGAKEKQALKRANKPGKINNIYNKQREVVDENEVVAVNEAIDYIHKAISQQETCQKRVKKSDIITVLKELPVRSTQASDMTKETIVPRSKRSTKSCQKIMQCLDRPYNKRECISTIQQQYNKHREQTTQEENLTDSFYGTQFYSNGTLDDSQYDLLVDINLIGDLMFGKNKKTPEILYYRTPSSNNANGPIDVLGILTNGSDSPLSPAPTSSQNNTIATGSANTPPKSNTPPQPPQKPSNTKPNHSQNTTKPITPTKQNNKSIKKNQPVQKNHQTPTRQGDDSTLGNPLFSNICAPKTQEDNDTKKTTPEPSYSFGGETEQTPEEIQETRNNYMNYINGIYTSYIPPQPTEETATGTGGNDDDGNNSPIASESDTLPLLEEVKACISDCSKNFQGSDALMCIAQCTCNTVPKKPTGEYLRYKIKYCRIPTQTEAPFTSDTKVQSIEEIVDAINSTLTALKQSGALHKRNETQEFLDTSLRNMKIGKSFIFSFNMATKTSVNTIPKKTLKEKAQAQHQNTIKKSPIYDNDRNKYLMTQSTKNTQETVTEKQLENIALIDATNQREIALNTFLKDMDTFWRSMESNIYEINKTAQAMNAKAKNAK